MERQARKSDGLGQGFRLERRDLWQPLADRQGDDGHELEWPSVLRVANGEVRPLLKGRSQRVGFRSAGCRFHPVDPRRQSPSPQRFPQRHRRRRPRDGARSYCRTPEHRGGGVAMKSESRKACLRCAVYTRVSTEHGLEQEFNSLDNQREASEAYVKSQAHESWKLIHNRYDDGDYSGGSMERPALKGSSRTFALAGST